MANGLHNCTNCKYFKAGIVGMFPGVCRRYPPVQHSQDSGYSFTFVDRASWCGEYEQLPPPPDSQ